MARIAAADTSRARLPQGTKAISTAFFTALDGIKEANRPEAAKAALATIKATIAQNRIKAREAAGKAKAKLATARTTSRSTTKDAAPTAAPKARRAAASATKAPRRGRTKAAPAVASESPSAD